MLLFIFSSLITLATGFDCQLNTYETSILDEHNPFLRQNLNIELNYYWQSSDSFGFGFWTKYLPYSDMNLPIDQVGLPIDVTNTLNGRLIFTIRPIIQENFILAYFQSLPLAYPKLNHTIAYVSDSKAKNYNISYITRDYQGYWEFTYLSFKPNYQVIEIIYGNLEKYGILHLPIQYINFQDYEITLGGHGKIQMTSSISYNLEAFPGRISRLIYLNNSAYITSKQQFSQTFTADCTVPNKFQSKQVVYLFEDIVQFDGTKYFYQEHKQEGNDYSIALWVKPNFDKFTQSDNMVLFRAYINRDYRDKQYLGDRSFFIFYYVDMLTNWTTLYMNTYAFKTPEKNATDGYLNNELRYWYPQIVNDALKSWHYISFIYGQSFYRIKSEIYIPKFEQRFQQIYGAYDISNQFTDTMMYFQLAVDRYFFSQRFQGEIAYMKFVTFINDDNYQNYPKCHYTCEQTLDCTGPTKNDCKSCTPQSNRVYIKFVNQCQCKLGYVEFEKEIQCQKFTDYYPSLYLYLEPQKSQLKFRQFKFNNFQLDCPQSYNKWEIRCLECLTDTYQWQFNPICQSDLQKYNGQVYEPYRITQRKEQDIELYYITSQGYALLCSGCLKYCKIGEESCDLSNYFHNGEQMGVICKQQQYFKDGYCSPCQENCIKCSAQGICLLCNDGFYYNQNSNTCSFCGSECKTCIYSNEYENFGCIIAQSNIKKYIYRKMSLFEGRCHQCGFMCGFCEFEFNIITKQYFNRYLRCLNQKEQFLSFDGINCFKKNIKDCLYGVQYKQTNRQLNTLDHRFQPQILDNSIITGCAKCDIGLVYTIADNTCSKFIERGIIGEFFVRETDQQKTKYEITCLQCPQNNYDVYKTTIVQTDLCLFLRNPLSQCRQCIQSKTYNILQCTLCHSGYYSSRLKSICIPCQLNCWMCSEQQINTQDLYKIDLKPFYEYFVNYDGNHDFREFGQSKDQNDYEVVCAVCKSRYELVNNRCVPQCPDNCKSCEIVEGIIQCLECYSTQQGVMLILWENQCIECPQNCNVCVPQSLEQIKSINPYFKSNDYNHYSHICLSKFEQDENLFWDSDLYKFIQCLETECVQSMQIKLNILCSDKEYDSTYNSILDLKEKNQYIQQNAKLSQVFSPNALSNLPQFENDLIFKYANEIGMKRIMIIFQISKDQLEQCILPLDAKLQQIFSVNIFNAMYFSRNIILVMFSSNYKATRPKQLCKINQFQMPSPSLWQVTFKVATYNLIMNNYKLNYPIRIDLFNINFIYIKIII